METGTDAQHYLDEFTADVMAMALCQLPKRRIAEDVGDLRDDAVSLDSVLRRLPRRRRGGRHQQHGGADQAAA